MTKRLVLVATSIMLLTGSPDAAEKIAFWDTQRKGANGDGGKDHEAWFRAAADVGIEYVRLAPENWQSHGRDFLLGDADSFTGIPAPDLQRLEAVLDIAHRHNVKVLLTMFSLPGARNRQSNDYKFDYRLWTDEKFQQQALAFWKELAGHLRDHPAIVGYNPLNEPHPARRDGFTGDDGDKGFAEWRRKHEGGPSDLNRFNEHVVEAIRSADPHTPIVLNGWFHSSPSGFRHLRPVNDPAVLYAFHFYEPWIFVTYRVNKDRFAYPDKMPTGQGDATRPWTSVDLHRRMQPVVEWARRYDIAAHRIIAEEFGCDRRVAGAKEYLEDSIAIFNHRRWHWAFYSFRSPGWDGLDYELGTEKLGWKYWQQREKGVDHEDLIKRHDNPLWDVFKRQLAPNARVG
jgi:aryl-phospho-beta-D-glucosidase BglC (GH1 family)